jgi:hypothetical protein
MVLVVQKEHFPVAKMFTPEQVLDQAYDGVHGDPLGRVDNKFSSPTHQRTEEAFITNNSCPKPTEEGEPPIPLHESQISHHCSKV